MVKLIIKILITLFGAIVIMTDLKENAIWLFSFWVVLALYMIFEGFFSKKKNLQ
ncbi:hypothetical protein ACIQ1H_05865 [Lysinibacillus sp. NPDC097279]|uniref:hypothetical protein n=1 Tax=Lysinibacillus sp. NPDC097279 TaxID=3364143 RepID=UPI0037F82DA4